VSPRTPRRAIATAAIVALILGVTLSRLVEPGVRVKKVMLAEETPALKFMPPEPEPHPFQPCAFTTGRSVSFRLHHDDALAELLAWLENGLSC